ncbi:SDR family oxidoreductase [Streptomyces zingiberis]|uniref:SDR family oxidoreductase n=1 Tax=Streptomyces zingiberis TaxID=2053010 RepID=UPI002893362B|nr:SDR family oxidoreductase [Streptomyces zingiberis]
MVPQSVLVTGGTGTLGRAVVQRLLDGAPPGARLPDGRPAVRLLSRRRRPAGDDRPYDWVTGDLGSGEGIAEAVAGTDVVIHCATTAGRGDVEATRRLTETVAGQTEGSPHLVHISIVGIDRIPLGYYRAKLECERIIESSQVPWTILRATQFHDLIVRIAAAQRRLPVALACAGVRFQPVDVGEVAGRLVELADGLPAGRAPDMGGPEVRSHADLTREWLRATGRRRPVLSLPLPGKAGRALRDGANLVPAGGAAPGGTAGDGGSGDGGSGSGNGGGGGTGPAPTIGRVTFGRYLAARHPG